MQFMQRTTVVSLYFAIAAVASFLATHWLLQPVAYRLVFIASAETYLGTQGERPRGLTGHWYYNYLSDGLGLAKSFAVLPTLRSKTGDIFGIALLPPRLDTPTSVTATVLIALSAGYLASRVLGPSGARPRSTGRRVLRSAALFVSPILAFPAVWFVTVPRDVMGLLEVERLGIPASYAIAAAGAALLPSVVLVAVSLKHHFFRKPPPGICPRCDYQLGKLAVCPECGPVVASSATGPLAFSRYYFATKYRLRRGGIVLTSVAVLTLTASTVWVGWPLAPLELIPDFYTLQQKSQRFVFANYLGPKHIFCPSQGATFWLQGGVWHVLVQVNVLGSALPDDKNVEWLGPRTVVLLGQFEPVSQDLGQFAVRIDRAVSPDRLLALHESLKHHIKGSAVASDMLWSNSIADFIAPNPSLILELSQWPDDTFTINQPGSKAHDFFLWTFGDATKTQSRGYRTLLPYMQPPAESAGRPISNLTATATKMLTALRASLTESGFVLPAQELSE